VKNNKLSMLCFSLAIIILLTGVIFTQEAEKQEITKAAEAWLEKFIESDQSALYKGIDYSLADYDTSIFEVREKSSENILSYVVDLNPEGFIIMSADKRINPVMGYSLTSEFSRTESPYNVLLYLIRLDMSRRMSALKQGIYKRTVEKKSQRLWNELLNKNYDNSTVSSKKTYSTSADVGPLLTTVWGQGTAGGENVFNLYTPNNWVSGCVSTALAQILKYYNWPVRGAGSHSYLEDDAGILSADFENTVYGWDNMLDDYSGESTQNQREAAGLLVYHAGVSTEMDYSEDGSSASTRVAAESLNEYFRTTGKYVSSELSGFHELLKTNMLQSRPAILSIKDSTTEGSGHAVVSDGYQESTGFYHLNFGWQGSGDSWYDLASEINAESYIFNAVNGAIVDIVPNPMFNTSADTTTFGTYTVAWGVSTKLNADYYELDEGIRDNQPARFFDGAENGTENWTIAGNWEASGENPQSGSYAFRGFLASSNIFDTHTITLDKSFYVTDSTDLVFSWMSLYFDGGKASLEVSTDGLTWDYLKSYSQIDPQGTPQWHLETGIDLSAYTSKHIFIRFAVQYVQGESYYDGSEYSSIGFFVDQFILEETLPVTWSTLDNLLAAASYDISGKSTGTCYYRVRAFRDNAWWGWSNVFEHTVSGATPVGFTAESPERFRLHQNYPNPFNPETVITYELPVSSHVRITVYNILGQHVKTLLDEDKPAGYYKITWDGTDERGMKVTSGVYFYRIRTDNGFNTANKMVLMR